MASDGNQRCFVLWDCDKADSDDRMAGLFAKGLPDYRELFGAVYFCLFEKRGTKDSCGQNFPQRCMKLELCLGKGPLYPEMGISGLVWPSYYPDGSGIMWPDSVRK